MLTGWSFAALLPGGYGRDPQDANDVPDVLNASCGWRDVLLKDLFSQIGIEGRRVNFYDVPYQGGHTATELKIGGKWMFFDATFGIYFTAKGSDVPLSIAETFQLWPQVEVRQSTLEGWQGAFIDPSNVPPDAYRVLDDYRLYMPVGFKGRPRVLGGEVNSLYLGPRTMYYVDNVDTPVPSRNFTWQEYLDTADNDEWRKIIDRFHRGRLDFRSGLLDDGSRWFVKYDEAGEQDWSTIISTVTRNSALDREVTVFDDGSARVIDWDQDESSEWTSITDVFRPDGTLMSRTIVNDDRTVLTPSVLDIVADPPNLDLAAAVD